MSTSTTSQTKAAQFHITQELRNRFGADDVTIATLFDAARAKTQEEADRREAHLQIIALRGLVVQEQPTSAWHPYPAKLEALAYMALVSIAAGSREAWPT